MSKRVVVTGMGAITPMGSSGEEFWNSMKEWKKGFYFIAMNANVPILLIGLDYGKKEARVLDIFFPTGNYEEDIVKIKDSFKDIEAKKPENFII